VTPADVLRATAAAYRNDDIEWGRDYFINLETGCRCALGGITYAVEPDDPDGNPFLINSEGDGRITAEAAAEFADYLVDVLDAPDAGSRDRYGYWLRDHIEVVGKWNDDPARTLDEVLAALDAAADRYDARQATT